MIAPVTEKPDTTSRVGIITSNDSIIRNVLVFTGEKINKIKKHKEKPSDKTSTLSVTEKAISSSKK